MTRNLNVMHSKSRGFSMLETLVTLFIISVWLLGSAGVQTIAMKLNKSSALRNQAILIAAEVGERIENNRRAAALDPNPYQYNGSEKNSLTTNCLSVPCDPKALAAFDIYEIYQRGQSAGGMIVKILPDDPLPLDPNVRRYKIEVTWSDRRTGQQYSTPGTAEEGKYTSVKSVYIS